MLEMNSRDPDTTSVLELPSAFPDPDTFKIVWFSAWTRWFLFGYGLLLYFGKSLDPDSVLSLCRPSDI